MATDYDAPRVRDRDEADPTTAYLATLASLDGRKSAAAAATLVLDDNDEPFGDDVVAGGPDLLGLDAVGMVLAQQRDEFMCTRCFLVQHHSRQARTNTHGDPVCRDCA